MSDNPINNRVLIFWDNFPNHLAISECLMPGQMVVVSVEEAWIMVFNPQILHMSKPQDCETARRNFKGARELGFEPGIVTSSSLHKDLPQFLLD